MTIRRKLDQAIVKHQSGDLGAAAQLYRAILDEQPDHPDALHMLGVIAQQLQKPDLALTLLDKALEVQPDLALAWHNRGLVLRVLGQRDEAYHSAQKALSLDSNLADAWDMSGSLLNEMGRYAEACTHHHRAVVMQPENVRFQSNYAVALLAMGDLQGAYSATCAHRRLDSVYMPITLGNVLKAAGYPERAIPCFQKSYELLPQYTDARINEAMARLLIGDFDLGWDLWQTRPDMDERYKSLPLWHGEKVKHLLVYEDQGLGDVLQCIRYVPIIKDRAEVITLQTSMALQKLLAVHFPDLVVLSSEAPIPQADARVRFLSLPSLCKTRLDNIPANIPYLTALQEWRDPWVSRLATLPKPRVGLVWAGNANNRNDHNRSLHFSQLGPLLDAARAHIVSLQKGPQKDQADFPASGIYDVASLLPDFTASAGLIAELDLVITVDTATAHLAGALDKPVWMMIPFDPDWRWMLGREDSPWYPKLRLFRQTKPGDWPSVVADVAVKLEELLAGNHHVLSPTRWTDPPLRQSPYALILKD
jgi:tetratricopeptide (TPR) repeat protein